MTMTIQTQVGKSVEADQGDLVRPIIRGKEPTGQTYAIEPRGAGKRQDTVLLSRYRAAQRQWMLGLSTIVFGGSNRCDRAFVSVAYSASEL
jgi:hypothetical protein